jgi:hypothetical protein
VYSALGAASSSLMRRFRVLRILQRRNYYIGRWSAGKMYKTKENDKVLARSAEKFATLFVIILFLCESVCRATHSRNCVYGIENIKHQIDAVKDSFMWPYFLAKIYSDSDCGIVEGEFAPLVMIKRDDIAAYF